LQPIATSNANATTVCHNETLAIVRPDAPVPLHGRTTDCILGMDIMMKTEDDFYTGVR
jgi:hypothetical protein